VDSCTSASQPMSGSATSRIGRPSLGPIFLAGFKRPSSLLPTYTRTCRPRKTGGALPVAERLSSITKLAPRDRLGQMTGVWFIAAALGNLFAGIVAGRLEVGAVAPDFELPGATRYGVLRDPVRLSDLRGKTVVLAFFFRVRTRG